jgi:predicted metalloprotease
MSNTTEPTQRSRTVASATQIARAARRQLIPFAVAMCVAIGGATFAVTSIVGAQDHPSKSTASAHPKPPAKPGNRAPNGSGTAPTNGGGTDTSGGGDTGTSGGETAPDVLNDNPQVDADQLDNLLVEVAAPDIEGFWAHSLSEVYGIEYQGLAGVMPYDPNSDQVTCGGQDAADPQNAFFCPADQFVAYDRNFFAQLASEHGAAATVFALAHEIGHWVEAQVADVDNMSTIQDELTADCLAGAWAADAADRGQLSRDDLAEAVDLMTEVADPAGTSPEDEGAHGTKLERIGSFNDGFEGGPQACITSA